MALAAALCSIRRLLSRRKGRSRARDLKRELREQFTEDYWRQRAKSHSRRFWLVTQRYRLGSLFAGAYDRIEIVGGSFPPLLRGFAFGGLVVILVLVIEVAVAQVAFTNLIPAEEARLRLAGFPALAAQVSASLLGFYLASVSIVLGRAYDDVAADVRSLVLRNPKTKLYLTSIGLSIGAGIALVLLQSLSVPFGLLTITLYSLIVVFSGWAFSQLAFGAFNLFDPVTLAEEPLRELYKAIARLDSKGLLRDEAVLEAASEEANRSLGILAHLIDLASKRGSVDLNALVGMVEVLLLQIRIYSNRKHLLAPNSAWFPRDPTYPKWVETGHTETKIALETSAPLPGRREPTTDWLERRSAEIASAALETCVLTNDRDAALRIVDGIASTAQTLARCYRVDDATTLAEVVRDRCWPLVHENENTTAVVIAACPPLTISNILLGWRDAITSWDEEICHAVVSTDWDSAETATVRIRGPERVWAAAQRLLRETQTEQELNGHRTTPDWYLQFELSRVCISTIEEFVNQLPHLLNGFVLASSLSSPFVRAATGEQDLQALAKADLVVDSISKSVEQLERLKKGNDPDTIKELKSLPDKIRKLRSASLTSIAEAVVDLTPEGSASEPDVFGQSLYTLVYHTERAIETGDTELVDQVLPNLIVASTIMETHLIATYGTQSSHFNPAVFDPTVDLLELSGLALIYEVLRTDSSADPVRSVWKHHLTADPQTQLSAKRLLNVLDFLEGEIAGIGTQRNMARIEWEQRLADQVVKAGYAIPTDPLSSNRTAWKSPRLLKVLGVTDMLPRVSVDPRAIFAASVIGPFTGESESTLRERPGLRRYFEALDRHSSP